MLAGATSRLTFQTATVEMDDDSGGIDDNEDEGGNDEIGATNGFNKGVEWAVRKAGVGRDVDDDKVAVTEHASSGTTKGLGDILQVAAIRGGIGGACKRGHVI